MPVQNVRVINKSRVALELVAVTEDGNETKLFDPRSKTDVDPKEWAKFKDCKGAVQYRDKLKWLIVIEQNAKPKKVAGLLEMTVKNASETVAMTDDEATLHAWLDSETRDDVKKIIDARLMQLANQLREPKG